MAGLYHNLPEDIIFEIFVRMPTKPLLRLRCLSKHWNCLISDHFMKSRSRRMVLLPFKPLHAIAIDNRVPGDSDVRSLFELPSPIMSTGSKHNIIIVGTFNGIVLLVRNKDMILYNPVIGAFKIVPNPSSEPSYRNSDAYGFCHGTTPEDLTIVRVRLANSIDCREASRLCDVFSLKKGSWSTKSRTLVQKCLIKDAAGTFVNGFLYWITYTSHSTLILALDVKEMVFSKIQLPYIPCSSSLGTLGGRLHVLDVDNDSAKFELWAMNDEHGIKKSWSKLFTSNGLCHVHPLSILDEGKIVMLKLHKQKQVIIYDILKDSYEAYKMDASVSCDWRLQAMEYVESLISPSDLCSSW